MIAIGVIALAWLIFNVGYFAGRYDLRYSIRRQGYKIREPGWSGLVRGMAPLPTERGEGFLLTPDGLSTYDPDADRD